MKPQLQLRMRRRATLPAWLFGICCGCSAAAHASESLSQLLACRAVVNATARLACFDRTAAALAAGPKAVAAPPPAPVSSASVASAPVQPAAGSTAGLPPVPTAAATTSTPAAVSLNPQQRFGLPERTVVAKEVAAGTRPADATKIEARLLRIAPAGDGRLVFTLDNGQAWRQLNLEGELLAKQGDAVTISRGWLGSYWLQLTSGRGCKVTRLR